MRIKVFFSLSINNTLAFCDTRKEHLKVLNWTFMWFEAISGLKINLHNSELIHIGEVPNFEELVRVLGCKVGGFYPLLLFGLPFKSHFQFPLCLGGSERKISEVTRFMENTIFIKRREIDFGKKHSF